MPTQIIEKAPNDLLPTLYNSIHLTRQLVPFIRINMVVNIVLIIVHTINFIWKFDSSSFMQFSSSFIVNIHLVLIQLIWVRIKNKIGIATQYINESLPLKREFIDPEMEQLMKNVIKKAYYTFLWIAGCVLFLVIVNRKYCYDESFVEHLVGRQRHLSLGILLDITGILLIIIWSTVSTIMMVSAPICFLYVMLQGKVAVIVLIDYVGSINHMKCSCKTTIKHLKIVIKKHIQIIRFNEFMLKSNQYFYLLYLFNEIFFGLLPMFQYFSPNRSIIAVSSATIYFFCLVYAVNDAGEEYITLVEYFRTAIINLKWYEWDVSCRKVYNILITYLHEPMKVDFVVVDINRALFWKILKTLYPVLNFFYTTNRINRV